MRIDDDEPTRKPQRLTILPLDTLSVADLRDYIEELRREISRTEHAIAAKDTARSAAESVFRLG